MHRLTVELPDPVYQELARMAQLTQQRPEALAAQSISSNLPPSVDNAPLEIQKELLLMQTQSVEELLRIANSKVSELQYQRHVELLFKNQAGSITAEERLELRELGLAADRLMLSKAYAWAVLRWRGHRIPSSMELPKV